MALIDVIMVPLLLMLAAAPTHARLLRARVATATGHPVEDVITLLKRLDSQADEEAKAEELTFQKFEHWCMRSKKKLQETIGKEESTLEALADVIASQQASMDTLSKDIASLTVELGELAKGEAKAGRARTAGAGLYDEKVESLSGTIEALDHAIVALTGARSNIEPELLQRHIGHVLDVASAHLSDSDRIFLEKASNSTDNSTDGDDITFRPGLRALGDYEKHVDVYAFKSHGVIELLKKLIHDFKGQLLGSHKAETNAINADGLAAAARSDLVSAASASKGEKESAHGDAEAALGEAQDAQRDTRSDLNADTNTLGSTRQACDQKAVEWAERSKVRNGEREAINIAVGILAKVSGVRTAPPENPVLPQSPVETNLLELQTVSFLQVPTSSDVKQALQLLREEARVSNSKAIAQLAAVVFANAEGPFDQVMNSIEKMVFHLKNEQREEDDHKNWCDLELEKTNATIVDKEDKLDELDGKIEVARTRANLLQNDIASANDMVNTIVAHMTESAEIRKTGREENALAIKDAEAAQTALTQAIAVLTTFYKSSGAVAKKDWEFVQQGGGDPAELEETPDTWEGGYTAVADPMGGSNGVLKLLESVLASFSTMESSTIAQDETDQNAFEQDMKECKIEKARRVKESEMKAINRKNVLDRQRALETTHKRVSTEKEATDQYLRDLQPACVEGDSTYEDRKSARFQEIAALKAAKDHLHSAFKDIQRKPSKCDGWGNCV